MADRILNAAACTLAVLCPLAFGLAAALVVRGPAGPFGAVAVLWGVWLLVLGGIVLSAWRWLR